MSDLNKRSIKELLDAIREYSLPTYNPNWAYKEIIKICNELEARSEAYWETKEKVKKMEVNK